jgi:hypothetical protein
MSLIQSDQHAVENWLKSAARYSQKPGVINRLSSEMRGIIAGIFAVTDIFAYPVWGVCRFVTGNFKEGLKNIFLSPVQSAALSVILFFINFAGIFFPARVYPSCVQIEEMTSVEVDPLQYWRDWRYERDQKINKHFLKDDAWDEKSLKHDVLLNINLEQNKTKSDGIPDQFKKDFDRGLLFSINSKIPYRLRQASTALENKFTTESIESVDFIKEQLSQKLNRSIRSDSPDKEKEIEDISIHILSLLNLNYLAEIHKSMIEKMSNNSFFAKPIGSTLFQLNINKGEIEILALDNVNIKKLDKLKDTNDKGSYYGVLHTLRIPTSKIQDVLDPNKQHSDSASYMTVELKNTKMFDTFDECDNVIKELFPEWYVKTN